MATREITDNDGNRIATIEVMNISQIHRSISLVLPATLDELEHFTATLRKEHVNGGTPVRAVPIEGRTTSAQLYVNIEEAPA